MVKKIDISTPAFPDAHALVDGEDYERVIEGPKWFVCEVDGELYAARSRGRNRKEFLHRVVLSAEKSQLVDHKNMDTLDCRKSNLRLCTKAQNGWNRGTAKHNTSGYKGVSRHTTRPNLWVAEIQANKRRYRLGCFKTPEAAAEAYDRAAIKYHGEFARTNKMIREEAARKKKAA